MWQDPTLAARSLNNAYAQLYIIMDGSKMESITKVQTLNTVHETGRVNSRHEIVEELK